MNGGITLLFLSLLVYLSVKGRLASYIALATTPAAPQQTAQADTRTAPNVAGSTPQTAFTAAQSQLSAIQKMIMNAPGAGISAQMYGPPGAVPDYSIPQITGFPG